MATEIEIKFRLDGPAAMRRKLVAAGAKSKGRVLERNTYFDTPDARLRAGDRGLRIRATESSTGRRRCTLTYKGPRRPGPMKIRREEEVAVSSPRAAKTILAALGYVPTLSFQKRREDFSLGGAVVSLDELPGLGFFLEIEAGNEAGVRRAARRLGLSRQRPITATYIALVAEHLSARPGRGRELKF